MTQPWEEEARTLIKGHEGHRDHMYSDTLNNMTAGYGHLIKQSDPQFGYPVGTPVPQEQTDAWFEEDFNQALRDARASVRDFDTLPSNVKIALTDMSYNMGHQRLSTFEKMLRGVNQPEPDLDIIRREMLDSDWADQTKTRAINLAGLIKPEGLEEEVRRVKPDLSRYLVEEDRVASRPTFPRSDYRSYSELMGRETSRSAGLVGDETVRKIHAAADQISKRSYTQSQLRGMRLLAGGEPIEEDDFKLGEGRYPIDRSVSPKENWENNVLPAQYVIPGLTGNKYVSSLFGGPTPGRIYVPGDFGLLDNVASVKAGEVDAYSDLVNFSERDFGPVVKEYYAQKQKEYGSGSLNSVKAALDTSVFTLANLANHTIKPGDWWPSSIIATLANVFGDPPPLVVKSAEQKMKDGLSESEAYKQAYTEYSDLRSPNKWSEQGVRDAHNFVARVGEDLNIPPDKVPLLMAQTVHAEKGLIDRIIASSRARAAALQEDELGGETFFIVPSNSIENIVTSERPQAGPDGYAPAYMETSLASLFLDVGMGLGAGSLAKRLGWSMPTILFGSMTTGKSAAASKIFMGTLQKRKTIEDIIQKLETAGEVIEVGQKSKGLLSRLGLRGKKIGAKGFDDAEMEDLINAGKLSEIDALKIQLKTSLDDLTETNKKLKALGFAEKDLPTVGAFLRADGRMADKTPLWMRVVDEMAISAAVDTTISNFVFDENLPFVKYATEEEKEKASALGRFMIALAPIVGGVSVMRFFRPNIGFSFKNARQAEFYANHDIAEVREGLIRPSNADVDELTLKNLEIEGVESVPFFKEQAFQYFTIPEMPWGDAAKKHYTEAWNNLKFILTEPDLSDAEITKAIKRSSDLGFEPKATIELTLDNIKKMRKELETGGDYIPDFFNAEKFLNTDLTKVDFEYLRGLHIDRQKHAVKTRLNFDEGPLKNLDFEKGWEVMGRTPRGAALARKLSDGSTEIHFLRDSSRTFDKNAGKLSSRLYRAYRDNVKNLRRIIEWDKGTSRAVAIGYLDQFAKRIAQQVDPERAEVLSKAIDDLRTLDYAQVRKELLARSKKKGGRSSNAEIFGALKSHLRKLSRDLDLGEVSFTDAPLMAYVRERLNLANTKFTTEGDVPRVKSDEMRELFEGSLSRLVRQSLPAETFKDMDIMAVRTIPANEVIDPASIRKELADYLFKGRGRKPAEPAEPKFGGFDPVDEEGFLDAKAVLDELSGASQSARDQLDREGRGVHVGAEGPEAERIVRSIPNGEKLTKEQIPQVLYGVDFGGVKNRVKAKPRDELGAKSLALFTSRNSAASYLFDLLNGTKIANAKTSKEAYDELIEAMNFDMINVNLNTKEYLKQRDSILNEAIEYGDAFGYYKDVWLARKRAELGGSSAAKPLPPKDFLFGKKVEDFVNYSVDTATIADDALIVGYKADSPHPNNVQVFSDAYQTHDMALQPLMFDMSLSNLPITRRGELRRRDILEAAAGRDISKLTLEEAATISANVARKQGENDWIGSIDGLLNMGGGGSGGSGGGGRGGNRGGGRRKGGKGGPTYVSPRLREFVDENFLPANWELNGFEVADSLMRQMGGSINENVAKMSDGALKNAASGLEFAQQLMGDVNWKRPPTKYETMRRRFMSVIPGSTEAKRSPRAMAAHMTFAARRGKKDQMALQSIHYTPEDFSEGLNRSALAMSQRARDLFMVNGVGAIQDVFRGISQYNDGGKFASVGGGTSGSFMRGTRENKYRDGFLSILERYRAGEKEAVEQFKKFPEKIRFGEGADDFVTARDMATALDILDETVLGPRRYAMQSMSPSVWRAWKEGYIPRIWKIGKSEDYRRFLNDKGYEFVDPDDPILRQQMTQAEYDLITGNRLMADPTVLANLRQEMPFIKSVFDEAVANAGRSSFLGGRRNLVARLKNDPSTFDFIDEMLNRGFVPLTDNPVEMIMAKADQMDHFLQNAGMVQQLMNNGLVFKLTKHELNTLGQRYRAIKGKGMYDPTHDGVLVDVTEEIRRLTAAPVTKEEIEQGVRMYADRTVANVVKNATSTGFFSKQKGWGAWRRTNNFLNSINLGWSMFHASGVGLLGQLMDDLARAVQLATFDKDLKLELSGGQTITGRWLMSRALLRSVPPLFLFPMTSLLQAGQMPVTIRPLGLPRSGVQSFIPGQRARANVFTGVPREINLTKSVSPLKLREKFYNPAFTYVDKNGNRRGKGFARVFDDAVSGINRSFSKAGITKGKDVKPFQGLLPYVLKDPEDQKGSMGEILDDIITGVTPSHMVDPVFMRIIKAGMDVNFLSSNAITQGHRDMMFAWKRSYPEAVDFMMGRGKPEDYIDSFGVNMAKQIGTAFTLPPRWVGDWAQHIQSWLFESTIPRLKRSAYVELMLQEVLRNPNMTDAQLLKKAQLASESIDNRMGMLNYDNLGMDRTMREMMFLYWRAPGWKIGTKRELFGGMKDALAGAGLKATHFAERKAGIPEDELTKSFGGADEYLTHRTAFLTAMFGAGTYMMFWQYLVTGYWPDFKDAEGNFWDAEKEYMPQILDKMRKLWFPLNGSMIPTPFGVTPGRSSFPMYSKELIDWLTDMPWGFAESFGHTLPPVAGFLYDVAWKGEDYYGHSIFSAEAGWSNPTRWLKDLSEYAFRSQLPFSVQAAMEGYEIQGKGVPAILFEFVYGITNAPRRMTYTPFQKELLQIAVDHKPGTTSPSEEKIAKDLQQEISWRMSRGEKMSNEKILQMANEQLAEAGLSMKFKRKKSLLARAQNDWEKMRNTRYGFFKQTWDSLEVAQSYDEIEAAVRAASPEEFSVAFGSLGRNSRERFINFHQKVGPEAGYGSRWLHSEYTNEKFGDLMDLFAQRLKDGYVIEAMPMNYGQPLDNYTEQQFKSMGLTDLWVSKLMFEKSLQNPQDSRDKELFPGVGTITRNANELLESMWR